MKTLIEIMHLASNTSEMLKKECTTRVELAAYLGILNMLVSLETIPTPEEVAAARITATPKELN